MSTVFTRSSGGQEADSVRVDTLFEVLADERRRHMLYYLADESPGVTKTGELVEYLRAVEPDAGDGSEVQLTLHHQHLPKMDEAGVIDYDVQDRAVSYDGGPLLEEILARVAGSDLSA